MARISNVLLGLGSLGLSATLVACGNAGSSTPGAGTSAAAGSTTAAASTPAGSGGASTQAAAACRPATSPELVVLEDDKNLQTVDNIIPAVNADAASPPLLEALNKVSAALTTDELVTLNRRVEVERQTSPNVARDYVAQENLTSGLTKGSGKVTVGAANFAENQTLANIYEQVLDAAGFDASVRTIGNRELYEPALEKGDIDVVPEYVGTLTEFLNKKQNGANAKVLASGDLDATVAALAGLGQKAGLRFGEPAQAADQNAFAVTKAFADANGLRTLTDLATKCGGGQIVLGGPPECPQRPFCRPGLESTYGLKFSNFVPLDAGGPLTESAIRQGRITVGLLFSSDGSLAGPAPTASPTGS